MFNATAKSPIRFAPRGRRAEQGAGFVFTDNRVGVQVSNKITLDIGDISSIQYRFKQVLGSPDGTVTIENGGLQLSYINQNQFAVRDTFAMLMEDTNANFEFTLPFRVSFTNGRRILGIPDLADSVAGYYPCDAVNAATPTSTPIAGGTQFGATGTIPQQLILNTFSSIINSGNSYFIPSGSNFISTGGVLRTARSKASAIFLGNSEWLKQRPRGFFQFWARSNFLSNTHFIMSQSMNDYAGFAIYTDNQQLKIIANVTNTRDKRVSGNPDFEFVLEDPTNNNWRHWVYTWDKDLDNTRIYLNTELVADLPFLDHAKWDFSWRFLRGAGNIVPGITANVGASALFSELAMGELFLTNQAWLDELFIIRTPGATGIDTRTREIQADQHRSFTFNAADLIIDDDLIVNAYLV